MKYSVFANRDFGNQDENFSICTDAILFAKVASFPGGRGEGYSRKVRIGVCREGSYQTKIDTLSKAQTRKMIPNAREEKQGGKRSMPIQTTTNRHGKHNA